MKAVKRNFLIAEEQIRLNQINYFQVSRYFNPRDFNLDDKLNLHFDYLEGLPVGGITKKNEQSVSLKLKEESKLLWKIGIQIRPHFDTLLHLSIS